ncbi:MAG: sigma 54-interacting transcriptional regulator [Polyangiales bacterium]
MTEATEPMRESSAPSPTVGVRLVVEEPGAAPRLAFVYAGQRLRVGRDPEAEVCLNDASASRLHAEVTFDGAVATLADLGSRNKTWLDERPVEGSARLSTGDVFRVGATRFAVVLIAGAAHRLEPEPAADVEPLGLGDDVVARDPASVAAFRLLVRLARSRLPVLLQGETGSGKEVAARVVHRSSPRAAGPFVAINCATLAEALAESELFGHEKGAFTGAAARRLGAFECAQGGTLFLDEVGELSEHNQARLLRALQERSVVRLGSTTPVPVDVRVVAATNRDLLNDIARGRFREDLYFRLNGATVMLPPLRARPLDVVPITERVLAEHGGAALGPGVAELLRRYAWPGNVRELRHAVEHALALGDGRTVQIEDLPAALRGASTPPPAADREPPLQRSIDEAERRAIVGALDANGWNQTRAARALGVTRRALIYRMERLGLKARPGSASGG